MPRVSPMPLHPKSVVATPASELVRSGGSHTAAETRSATAGHKADRMRTAKAHTAAETPAALDYEAMTNRTKQAPLPAFKAYAAAHIKAHT